MANNQLLCV